MFRPACRIFAASRPEVSSQLFATNCLLRLTLFSTPSFLQMFR